MHPDLPARVAALESQLRRWRIATTVFALLVATLTFLAAESPDPRRPFPGDQGSVLQMTPNRIASHSFVLVGKDGTVFARLTASNGSPAMEFYDAQGHIVWSAPPQLRVQPVTAQPAITSPAQK